MDALLFAPFLGKALWLWIVFFSIIAVLLVLDLGVLHRRQHEIGVKESVQLCSFYVTISLLFGLFVWYVLGPGLALEYFTGYIIEQSLSMDNIFVMAVIFGAMKIPRMYQHRVLFWGIMGVILMRGVMIVMGATLIHNFHWILYLFAAFLVLTGFKLLFMKDSESDPKDLVDGNPVVRYLRRHFNITRELHGQKFIIRQPHPITGKSTLFFTPLFLTLITIEMADVLFAVDSVPAIFAITSDTFIVFSSNIFAILGLRALYFALSAMLERFAYLKYALALVLIFIGSKVFLVDLFGWQKFPPAISLGVTLGLLTIGVVYSLYKTRDKA